MNNTQLKQTLVEICSDIGGDDLEKLKFLLKDVTGSGRLEKATMAIDLFSAIEHNKQVRLHDGKYLAECFCLMGRCDLVRMLKLVPKDIEEEMETNPRILPFRVMLYKICEDLSTKEYEGMKFYASNSLKFKRKQLEKVKNTYDLLILLEKGTLISPTNLTVLKDMMRSLGRGDLQDIIDEYQEKYPQMMDCESSADQEINGTGTLPIDSAAGLPELPQQEASLSIQPPTSNTSLPSLSDPPVHVYEMTSYPRGYCIIINNKNFDGMPDRLGTDVDARKLNETFHKLGFQVRVYCDLNAKEMVSAMREVAILDHSKFNALVVFILSHGEENVVYGVDKQMIPVRYLTMFFRSSKCKTLADKPKLFFIQACQGQVKQSGIPDKDLWIQHDGPSESSVETDAETISADITKVIPDESDFLIGYATVIGYASFRHRTRGTFYIKTLTENLEKYAGTLDLVSILTRVNHDVSAENIPGGDNGEIKKQVPMPQFTLRKLLFFSPDNLPPARTVTQPCDA